jgi:hypothetical protein
MRQKRHPLSGAFYDVLEDGNVQVVEPDGRQGLFTTEGVWLAGELRSADPHMCGWVGGRQVPDPVKAAATGREASS